MKDQIRAEFEQQFPLPDGVTFDGDHYVADPNVLGAFTNATVWSHMYRGWKAAKASKLSVWYGSMPESNGKSNWTAILHKGDITEGMTIDRSEYPDRVRYEADCVRYLIGELSEKPFILDYDADKHSGYKPC